MTDHYANLWLKQYGEIGSVTFNRWVKGLRNFRPQTLLKATERVINEGHAYPPNLIGYMRQCRAAEAGEPIMYQTALPPPPLDRDSPEYLTAREEHFERCRELGIL